LTRGDFQAAVRLLSIAGEERYKVNLKPSPVSQRITSERAEDVIAKTCPGCDEVEICLPKYQAEFLHKWRAPWPRCKACR
jgi:hypothetical protein